MKKYIIVSLITLCITIIVISLIEKPNALVRYKIRQEEKDLCSFPETYKSGKWGTYTSDKYYDSKTKTEIKGEPYLSINHKFKVKNQNKATLHCNSYFKLLKNGDLIKEFTDTDDNEF